MSDNHNAKAGHPDRDQCLKMLSDYGTPAHVVGHCKAVSAVACIIGEALNRAGGTKAPEFREVRFQQYREPGGRNHYRLDKNRTKLHGNGFRPFDIELARAAGLIHDMARVEDRHWDVCADFCHNMGLYEEEQIVRVHMQYEFTTDAFHLTEADLVAFGDRLVTEDKYVGLDARMDYIIRKAERNGNFQARPKILKKKEETRKLLTEVEGRIGITLDELLSGVDAETELE